MAQISGFLSNFPFLTAIVLAFFLLYWTNAFFIVYHLTRFGIGPVPKMFALVFLLGSMLLFSLTTLTYSRVDSDKVLEGIRMGIPENMPGIRFNLPLPSRLPIP